MKALEKQMAKEAKGNKFGAKKPGLGTSKNLPVVASKSVPPPLKT
jgi:hypothetical protein